VGHCNAFLYIRSKVRYVTDMPSYFLRQPNGLFARFSTVVDNFTHYAMTREEALGVARHELGRGDAEAKIQRAVDDDVNGMGIRIIKDDGLNRWRDCLETIQLMHGDAELAKVVAMIENEPTEPQSPPPQQANLLVTVNFLVDPDTGWFTAVVKEHPEVVTQGETLSVARARVRDALSLVREDAEDLVFAEFIRPADAE
jgi:predicted RNase H-like HicB family nuclease